MRKIFTPKDAENKFIALIPDYVFDAFNDLLSEKYNEYEIRITQNEAINRIIAYSNNEHLTRETIFKNKWLDIEKPYSENGWKVEYDKPGFNEHYEAYFIFKPIIKNFFPDNK